MAFESIGIGTTPNDGTGDNLRVAAGKLNTNFTLLASSLGAANIGTIDSGTGATEVALDDVLRPTGVKCIRDFLSAAQRTDVFGYTGSLDVTAALNAAEDATPDGGLLVLLPGVYKTTGWTISKRIDIIGLGCTSGAIPSGVYLTSNSNAQIVILSAATQNVWMRFENIGIIGNVAAGSSQHGLQVNNGGAKVRNVVIRECGGSGMVVTYSIAGHYENIVSYSNAGSGFLLQSAGGASSVGNNLWQKCLAGGNGSYGWNLAVVEGSDLFVSCNSENNTGRGLHVGAAVKGCRAINWYSEGNTAGSALFDATSEENRWDFESVGYGGEAMPTDNGANNRWTGRANGLAIIEPKCMQRVYTEYTDVASSSPNTIPYDDTIPQSTEGATVMTRIITPTHASNRIVVKASGQAAVAAGTTLTVALFLNSETDARAARAYNVASVDTPVSFHLEYEMAAPSTSAMTFALNVGSSSAGTVTFNGVSGARKFGAISKSTIACEEYLP